MALLFFPHLILVIACGKSVAAVAVGVAVAVAGASRGGG